MKNAQRAALLLLGLQDEDREFILANLSQPAREHIAPCIKQLREMGVPPQHDWLSLLGTKPATRPRTKLPEHAIARADAKTISRLLAQEPAGLVGALLSSKDWPWASEFVEALPSDRRAALTRHMKSNVKPAPYLILALQKQIAFRLSEVTDTQSAFDAQLVHQSARLKRKPVFNWRPTWAR